MTQKEVLLKEGTILGQLFHKSVIPEGALMVELVDEILDRVTTMYIEHHDEDSAISPPSFLEGPVFIPTKEELTTLGLEVGQDYHSYSSTYTISYGPDRGETENNEMSWDINPELSPEKRTALFQC